MITSGQSFVSAPPAFSNDGKKLLVCTGCSVSVFSTATGMQVTELEGHEAAVTAVVVAAAPPVATAAAAGKFVSHCWTAALDGMIFYWDFAAAEVIKKVKVGMPIHSMVIPHICNTSVGKNESSTPFAFISVEDTNTPVDQEKLRGQIQIYNLKKSSRVKGLLAKIRKPEQITVSKSGEFLGIKNKQTLYIWSIFEKDFKPEKIRRIKLHHTKSLSTLAFHPSERIVAGGDVTGRILIWRGFGKKKFSESHGAKSKVDEERPGVRDDDDADSCSTWHWHPSKVEFLLFSSDGAYLFSGGKEGVIVVWQLDTGKRKYKPRLGSPLLFFVDSPDPTVSCVSLADNQIHILKMPTMEIMKSIAGIKLPLAFPDQNERPQSAYAYDYANGLVALPTDDYCIQFYSLFESIEVSQVQICERNFQPVDEITVYISLISLSIDGSLMCTVDVKLPEEELGGLITLKFWTRGPRAGQYFLSTVVYEPHSDAGVSDVALHPGKNMAVSTSFGGNFKVWAHNSCVHPRDERHQKSGWRCQSVGSYKKKPMTAAAFPADGSILAVAAENVITLWNPDGNVLVGVIGEALSPITKLSFIGTSEYLVSLSQSSKPQLAVWNVSSLSMYWSYKLFAEVVSCTASATHFAVLALLSCPDEGTFREQDGIILLFNVENPHPTTTWSVKKAKGGSLSFLKSNPSFDVHAKNSGEEDALLLAYINGSHEYVIFDPQSKEELQISKNARKRLVQTEEAVPIGYTSIYGELPKLEMMNQALDVPFVPSERPWETIFSGSSHVLPPLTKLCSVFFGSLLEKRPAMNE